MLEYQQHVEMSMCWWMQLSKDGMEYARMEARMEWRKWNSHIATHPPSLSGNPIKLNIR